MTKLQLSLVRMSLLQTWLVARLLMWPPLLLMFATVLADVATVVADVATFHADVATVDADVAAVASVAVLDCLHAYSAVLGAARIRYNVLRYRIDMPQLLCCHWRLRLQQSFTISAPCKLQIAVVDTHSVLT